MVKVKQINIIRIQVSLISLLNMHGMQKIINFERGHARDVVSISKPSILMVSKSTSGVAKIDSNLS